MGPERTRLSHPFRILTGLLHRPAMALLMLVKEYASQAVRFERLTSVGRRFGQWMSGAGSFFTCNRLPTSLQAFRKTVPNRRSPVHVRPVRTGRKSQRYEHGLAVQQNHVSGGNPAGRPSTPGPETIVRPRPAMAAMTVSSYTNEQRRCGRTSGRWMRDGRKPQRTTVTVRMSSAPATSGV
ncbi:dynein heavy chain 2, axonemal [Anopheles sinensis]|uniref:Dynein heavy chain 2, axonemal n=1 Tax=Anopheles sinensis TaxID=74873 RepID=A0A084VU66_ANOSI|nr:dynein heavy chain 2, axonemal [Anopheles sinensis]